MLPLNESSENHAGNCSANAGHPRDNRKAVMISLERKYHCGLRVNAILLFELMHVLARCQCKFMKAPVTVSMHVGLLNNDNVPWKG